MTIKKLERLPLPREQNDTTALLLIAMEIEQLQEKVNEIIELLNTKDK